MYTVRRRRQAESPRGDYITECDYCGVCWPRFKLRMDRSGLLACPDEGPGLSSTALSEGNAAMANQAIRTPPRRGGRACVTNAFGPSQHLCDLDTTPPELLTLTPPDNSVNITANLSAIVLTFDKNMSKGTGNIYLYEGGVLVETINVNSTQVLLALGSVTINLTYALSVSQTYYVLIDQTALTDCNQTAWAGFALPTDWNWATADTSAPLLIASTPPDNALDICYNADIQLVFNDNVQPGVGTIFLKKWSDDSVVDSWAVGVDAVFTLNIVDLPLSGDLGSDTMYYLEIAAGVIEDDGGNPYAGLVKGDLNFTTVDTTPEVYVSTGEWMSTVPSWATSAHLKLRGGGGGGGGGSDEDGGPGGGSATVDTFIDVSAIGTLHILVGDQGHGGDGGGPGAGLGTGAAAGGGGGGYTGVFVTSIAHANALAVAGTGGGGGGGDELGQSNPGGAGGHGGAANGAMGGSKAPAIGGQGGTQAAGGAGGTSDSNAGTAGGALTGGVGGDGEFIAPQSQSGSGGFWGSGGAGGDGYSVSGGAGGGGSGYYGGGGGGGGAAGDQGSGAGGGGGSSFITGWNQNVYAGSGVTPGNPGDPDLDDTGTGGAGGPGALIGGNGEGGQDGRVWIQYGCEVAP